MRPRKTDKHLPSCVYQRGKSYYLVKNNKWVNLGSDLSLALREYARQLAKPSEKMPGLLEKYLATQVGKLADNTLKSYRVAVNHLSRIMVDFEPDQVKVKDVLDIMDYFQDKPGTANILRSVLIKAFDYGIREQYVEINVARQSRPLKVNKRGRYITDAEYKRIHDNASPLMRVIMDLCYLTGQRISDIITIKYADLTEDGILFVQKKTNHRMLVAWNADLKRTVETARQLHKSVKGITLLHNRDGSMLLYDRIMRHWHKACESAGVEDAHIHDLRAKAGTDAEKSGLDSMALLGHQSESSHKRYMRDKETPVAIGMSFKKTKSAA